MNYARWNFDNRPEGFEKPKLGIFGAWESLVICVHLFFFGAFVALAISCALFLAGHPKALTAAGIGLVWLLFSAPFIMWFKARFKQQG
jgi:hypothetical protein